ncbi:uncharacterized protein BJX67DRAFT_234489 [Aspergillus lucknowensis]|uniref:Uncharacterized protein n=1 Tax=Aspergillus lucknowensis TaxID=176173 RepID=A0ABR4LGV1_9EURO
MRRCRSNLGEQRQRMNLLSRIHFFFLRGSLPNPKLLVQSFSQPLSPWYDGRGSLPYAATSREDNKQIVVLLSVALNICHVPIDLPPSGKAVKRTLELEKHLTCPRRHRDERLLSAKYEPFALCSLWNVKRTSTAIGS